MSIMLRIWYEAVSREVENPPPTHSLTNSLTHSLTNSLTHSLTHRYFSRLESDMSSHFFFACKNRSHSWSKVIHARAFSGWTWM